MSGGESQPGGDSAVYEEKHVHEVYEQIASHFSSTRYKPWPIVDTFLRELPSGSVGLDVGCGNGKYLTVNQSVFIVGSDRSQALANIAKQHQPHSTVVADILNLPHPHSTFDFAISIAVIHHLSTQARRVQAIQAIIHTLKKPGPRSSGGQLLIFAWALEQKASRRGWDTGDQQDVMVPWIMKEKHNSPAFSENKIYNRYYHLYRAGELEQDVAAAGGHVVRSGYEKDNWWAIVAPVSAS